MVKDFGTSKVYIPLKGLKGKPITVHAFLQDNDGNIWVVTPFGVYTINYNDYRVTNIIKGSTSFEMYISIIQQKKMGIYG
ncbi:two-component regulator propeller domain-containing protein [Tenacibaculum retecalamus]|uniref:two-component regulator propeller domain-containing protein n=1 Tax=Tenacibaculum retecalamus TaxID=3018315 RepID=UPI0023D905A1|nr:two-component regulator propeller domain-containing protein [Tenacibaculum retecalamus]WBX71361.1 hypothetical protein PG912_00725 [Tenacibaculum retecalamus]